MCRARTSSSSARKSFNVQQRAESREPRVCLPQSAFTLHSLLATLHCFGLKPYLFVADLHLAAERPALYETFLCFLDERVRHAQALYILGDLFEYWVGDEDADAPFHRGVMEALAGVGKIGVPVYLMHGNRDFLVGKRAAARGNLRLIADPTVIDVHGTPTLLMHGDTLCTDDVAYQRVRNRLRRPWILRTFLALPFVVRRRIGAALRAKSERTKRHTAPEIMDVNAQAVENVLRSYGYPRLIHGHTHRPARHA